jgi:hypothetical protein
MMRRRYRASQSPRKAFINSYHVNEVPLPYYNPLEDPFLSGFFSNEHVSRQLSRSGLLYSPRKEYPYSGRRLTNFNKFLRSNSHFIPATHLLRRREDSPRPKNFSRENPSDHQSTRSQLAKKLSDSDFLGSPPHLQAGELLSKRPSTTRGSQSSDRAIHYRNRPSVGK